MFAAEAETIDSERFDPQLSKSGGISCNQREYCSAPADLFESCLQHFAQQFADELRRAFRENLASQANHFPTDRQLG
ncbi:hypothetical protein LQG66_07225 [Bradyrhizobium ontarionense]|uniref:Uncharacterized protein n=1 Tax=Bradyrhizobium ontarionense TaxID=2898149 RepID=A0ABY3RGH7_9BRAD|nr:hypothetical protein [Bradyrhizobium sp. A19]UFZ06087.1 hypothetical protein LQG66_07225 [Bradyrhizobium sp. A19]